MHGVDLRVYGRGGSVGDVQDDVGQGDLLEGRTESLDQIVWQLAHEPNGVGERGAPATRQLQTPYSGSSVAKSWSATTARAPVSRFSSVDFPAFV